MDKTIFDDFIDGLNANIRKNYNTIAEAFENEYKWPEVDSVRSEVCKCLICGFYQAAITLTNHLLESVLKKALIIDESARNKTKNSDICNIFDESTNKYTSKNLKYTIEQARIKMLITKEEAKTLDGFRDKYRNSFSHADSQKTFKGISIPVTKIAITDQDSFDDILSKVFASPNISISAENNVLFQGVIQGIMAERQATGYFLAIDRIIHNLRCRLFGEEAIKTQIP